MNRLAFAPLALLLTACSAVRLPHRLPTGPVYVRVEQLYFAQDWQGLSEYAAVAMRDFNFEESGSASDSISLWRMAEGCERAGNVRTQAVALRALTHLGDPDAPLALVDFAKAHGREPLERCGAVERTEVVTWLAMGDDCERGDFARARERIREAFPGSDGVPEKHTAASHILLGDLLRRAERCEAALVEYTTAAFARSELAGPLSDEAQRDRTLGCVRLESLLFEMGEGDWALQAMILVNQQKALLASFPRSQALDKAVRDGANAEAAMMQELLFKYDLPEEPKEFDFERELAGLTQFHSPQLEGAATSWSAPEVQLKLTATVERLRVECGDPRVGTYEVAWTSREWDSGLKCFVLTEPTNSGGKCVRSFRDGSLFFGSSGFASEGLLLRRVGEPYLGPGLFGQPLEDAVKVVNFRKNEPAPGPRIEGLGERRSFVADVACGGVLVGEGYVNENDELIPDGVVRLSYKSDQWFRTRFSLGVAAPWRRSGTVIHRSDLSRLEDVTGAQVAWVDPEQWFKRIEQAKELFAAAQQAEADRAWRMQMEAWQSMSQYEGHGVEIEPEVGVYTCYRCDGIGSIYSGGGWESYSYLVQTDPGSPPSVATGSRWVSGQSVPCPECFGSGRKSSR